MNKQTIREINMATLTDIYEREGFLGIQSYINSILEEIEGKIEKNRKEQLDRNDLDNYGACYAIVGFNDSSNKSIAILNSYKTNKE